MTALSRLVCPGLSPSSYLWFDDTHDGWVRSCDEQRLAITGLVRRHLASTDEAVIRELFSVRGGGEVPVRAGYWLADRLATHLLRERHVAP